MVLVLTVKDLEELRNLVSILVQKGWLSNPQITLPESFIIIFARSTGKLQYKSEPMLTIINSIISISIIVIASTKISSSSCVVVVIIIIIIIILIITKAAAAAASASAYHDSSSSSSHLG